MYIYTTVRRTPSSLLPWIVHASSLVGSTVPFTPKIVHREDSGNKNTLGVEIHDFRNPTARIWLTTTPSGYKR